jgi:hypothetical protein
MPELKVVSFITDIMTELNIVSFITLVQGQCYVGSSRGHVILKLLAAVDRFMHY